MKKTVFVLMGINVNRKYIVAVFRIHADAIRYAEEWNITGWHIYEAPFF